MAIVTFYNGDPKDAPKTTMPARLGANAIITCKNRLLLEKRSDSDVWGLVGGGCKKWETGRQAIGDIQIAITHKDIVEDWFCKGENARVCE